MSRCAHGDPSVIPSMADNGIEEVLLQLVSGPQKLPRFSRPQITPTKTKYGAFDPEPLVAYNVIENFHQAVEVRYFIFSIDHKPNNICTAK